MVLWPLDHSRLWIEAVTTGILAIAINARFIVALLNGTFTGSFGRGLRLSDTEFLTNDPNQITEFFTPIFAGSVGQLEAEQLRTAPAVIYGNTKQDAASFTEAELHTSLAHQLGLVNLFLMALWLVKDNAVNIELGFSVHSVLGSLGERVASNFRARPVQRRIRRISLPSLSRRTNFVKLGTSIRASSQRGEIYPTSPTIPADFNEA